MFINNNFKTLIFLNYYWLQINTDIKCIKWENCGCVFYLLTREKAAESSLKTHVPIRAHHMHLCVAHQRYLSTYLNSGCLGNTITETKSTNHFDLILLRFVISLWTRKVVKIENMDSWPSERVAHGGLFHLPKVTYSKETHALLKCKSLRFLGIFYLPTLDMVLSFCDQKCWWRSRKCPSSSAVESKII